MERPRESADDLITPFQIEGAPVRGRVVRLGPAIDDILAAHGFPDPVAELLGEAAALVAMMGAALKFDGKLIFQAQGDGPVAALVADYTADGGLRATATIARPPDAARGLALLGRGHLALTIDQGSDMERYQGVTPIEGASLADAAAAHFLQSEQIPSAIRLAVGRVRRPGEARSVWRAGGVMAQFIPAEGGVRERGEAALNDPEDRETWARAAILLETTRADELLDPGVTAEDLLYRLYHEDGVRVFGAKSVSAYCACSAEKIEAVLGRYAAGELDDMTQDGAIRVACEFCRKSYAFDAAGRSADPR